MMRTLVLMLFAATATACGGGFRPGEYPDPAALMAVSEEMFRSGNCNDAIEGFRQLSFQTPARDSLGLRARFMLAECHFARQEYLEAARQFRRVLDEAPGSELGPRALLRAGDAQAQLWKRPELDPTYGDASLATYQELITRFPNSEAAKRASIKVAWLNDLFAEKEFKNGVYYHRLKAYDSAILYFKNLVADYPQSTYAPRALLRLVDIYERLEYKEERGEMCQYLQSFHGEADGVADKCPVASQP